MNELATKRDLQDLVTRFDAGMDNLSGRLDTKRDNLGCRLDSAMDSFSRHMDSQLENFSLRITIRFAVMLIAFIGAVAALIKLT